MTITRRRGGRSRTQVWAAAAVIAAAASASSCSYSCKAIGYLDSVSIIVGPGATGPPERLCLDDACFTEGSPDGDGSLQIDPGRVIARWSAGRMPGNVRELHLTTATVDVRLAKPKIVKVYPQDHRCGFYRKLELRYVAATNTLEPVTG